jgi:hypothetical protein
MESLQQLRNHPVRFFERYHPRWRAYPFSLPREFSKSTAATFAKDRCFLTGEVVVLFSRDDALNTD